MPAATSLADLLSSRGVCGRFAVEVNGCIVPRGAHAEHVIRSGDVVEVVRAIGGG